jgi:D-3-phosphoglycerate dehydrogenase
MYRILVADPINPVGLEMLEASGAEVHRLTDDERPRLAELLPEYDALVVRSATKVTAELLKAGQRLKVVGRAGIGVDNVDVAAATERGILVVNAPTANALSATEHTFALMLSLARRVCDADASLKKGEWDRKRFVGVELQKKTLGIIGFGRIGQRVAARARGFDMEVVAYDPFLDATVAEREKVTALSLEELLPRADFITLHTPLTEGTRNLLNAERLKITKPGALLVNCGRGGVVDEVALLEVLESGHLGGAAIDVFASEPLTDFRLASHPRVVATPHIGAQTKEAQLRIATETAKMVLRALDGSLAITAVNLPFRPSGTSAEPLMLLGEQMGHLAAEMLGGKVTRVQVQFWKVEEGMQQPITVAVLRGALTPALGDGINYVNAESQARTRGVDVIAPETLESADYPQLVQVRLDGPEGRMEIAGTLFGDSDARIVRFRGFPLEFRPDGQLLLLRNRDVPGVVGELGQCLGNAGINIADIHLARHGADDAVAMLRLDQMPGEATLAEVRAMPGVLEARLVDLRRGRGE